MPDGCENVENYWENVYHLSLALKTHIFSGEVNNLEDLISGKGMKLSMYV